MNRTLVVSLAIVFILGTGLLFADTQFSQEHAARVLRHLSVTIGPRTMGSPAELSALGYAIVKFKEFGCDTAYIMPMTTTSRNTTTSGIAIGVKRGLTDKIIVLGGHIDSAEPEIAGANDDGSGCAVVLEASRVLCSTQHQSTLVFCCFGGEEQGLQGSKYFVEHFPAMDAVQLMLQADMANGSDIIGLDSDTYGASAPPWLVRATVEEFYRLGYKNLSYPNFFFSLNYATPTGSGSDHESFLKYNVPAIDLTTDANDPIHTPQDNFENFDPRGLKRTGDVLIALVERFDGGVPDRSTDQYFLLLLGQTPLFLPITALQIFVVVAVILTLYTILILRKKRERSPVSGSWTFLKLFYFTLIVVAFGWFSTNLVGLFKGVRHPWFANPQAFYPLILAGLCTGVCFGIWLTKNITTCPYKLFRSSVIVLFVWLILMNLLSVKVALAPAFALLLVSLAMLVQKPLLRVIFLVLSPVWMMRQLFFEWIEMFYRMISSQMPTSVVFSLVVNVVFILFFGLYLLPFVFAAVAVVRSVPSLETIVRRIKTGWAPVFSSILLVGFAIGMTNLPSYNRIWHKTINAKLQYDMNSGTPAFTLKSPEYFDHAVMISNGVESRPSGKVTEWNAPVPATFNASLVRIHQIDDSTNHGDTTDFNVVITLATDHRPYRVLLEYTTTGNNADLALQSPFVLSPKMKSQQIEFYSFPDTFRIIPVQFRITGNDTVKQKISVQFNELPQGTMITAELTNVIPRMEYIQTRKYFKATP